MRALDRAERLTKRAEKLARESIGAEFTVKRDGLSFSGTIVACEVKDWRQRGRSVVCFWRVVLECGTAKARQSFVVRRLPRGGGQ
jgi:hypothetical protein